MYYYSCTVIDDVALYRNRHDGNILIQYSLKAEKFAEACAYNEDTAFERAPNFGEERDTTMGYPPNMDSFMNMVKLECRRHG